MSIIKHCKALKAQLHGLIALIFLCASTLLFFVPILILGLVKLVPNKSWRIRVTRSIDTCASAWCSINKWYIDNTQQCQWNIKGLDSLQLQREDWYLIVANHQSWLDIVLLQRLFNRSTPFLKFFIKDQLKWVPLLGFAWWAMGSPFMKRHSKEYLLKNPHKQGEDLRATQKALSAFQQSPSAIMNFVEGTRFTPEKQARQASDYTYLLRPKAGGLAFVISSMGGKIHQILDVTIVYSEKNPSLWNFLCHKIQIICAEIRAIPIPQQFIDNSQAILEDNNLLQAEFRKWINGIWEEKDALIARQHQRISACQCTAVNSMNIRGDFDKGIAPSRE